MGYFQHLHSNWQESDAAQEERVCSYCGGAFTPYSPNQRRHSYQHLHDEGNPCAWEYELEHMGPRQYLAHVGMTRQKYIDTYGLDQYNTVVLQRDN
jgi:hypothetical protein